MGKKVFLIFIIICFQVLSATPVEFGKITALTGDITLSRNNKIIQPINSSRIYLGETIKTSQGSSVKIKTNYDNYLLLNEQSSVKILSPKNFLILSGELYVDSHLSEEFIISSLGETNKISGSSILADITNVKKLTTKEKAELFWINEHNFIYLTEIEKEKKNYYLALGQTALCPGWGHYYLENKTKAYPMLALSGYLLYNTLTINPGGWQSEEMHEIMYNKKQQFQQLYLVYWLWAMFDTYHETNVFNNQITITTQEIKVSLLNKNF